MKSRRGRAHLTGVSNLDSLEVKDSYKARAPFSAVLEPRVPSNDLSRVDKRKAIQSFSPPPKSSRRLALREPTPLPELPRSKSTVRDKPKASLSTISEARKALRQRYVNRSNFRKIFNLWDRGNLGCVRPEDVHYMTNKLGIPVSKEEASLLVATANRSKTGRLSLDEFLDLLFGEEPQLEDRLVEATDLPTVRAELEAQAMQHHAKAQDDILKTKIKSRLHELTQDMIKKDLEGKGKIPFADFCVVLDSLKLPADISNLSQWEKVYAQMGGDQEGLDYRVFAEKFKGLDRKERPRNPIVDEYSQKVKPATGKVPVSSHAFSVGNYTVLDGQKVPVNTLEGIQVKARKLKRLLRSRFQNEAALKEELARIGEGQGIPLARLKNFMNYEATKEATTETVTKRDIEGFLSAFQYNTDGNADVQAVAKSIFSEEYSDDTLTRKTRAMPPAKPRMGEADPASKEKLRSMLTELENKLFVQRNEQAFSAFKMFDADGDGYVSHEDFERGLQSLGVPHEAQDARQLMDFLDENKNGFLSFPEFAKGVRPDILNSHAKRLLGKAVAPALQPSKEFYQRHLEVSGKASEDLERARQAYLPDGKTPSVPATRYGLRPSGANTRDVVQPSPLLDVSSSLKPKNLEPISLTQEDKERKSRLVEAKLAAIKEYRGKEADSIAHLEEALAEHRNRKLWQKAQVKEDYEKVSAMQRCKVLPA